MRRPTLPATRGLCRAQPPLVFSAHPETSTAASTIFQLRHIRRAAPVGAQMPWTTWGRFAHDSPRARVEVHLPCVLESRSAGQHALAPPTDGHPPTSGNLNANSTTMQPFPNTDADTTNRHATTTFSQPFPQPSCNRFPTPRQPSGTSTRPQPTFNRHATASQSQLRLNRFQITFQPFEAARRMIPRLANSHDSTTLSVEGEGDCEGRAFPES